MVKNNIIHSKPTHAQIKINCFLMIFFSSFSSFLITFFL